MRKARTRLIWLCPEFTPYQETLFRAIGESDLFDLHVEVMWSGISTHPYEGGSIRGYSHQIADADKRIDRGVVQRILGERDAEVVVSSYMCPTLVAVMQALVRKSRRFCFWSDVPLPRWSQWNGDKPKRRSLLRELARRSRLDWIYKQSHRILVMGTPGLMAAVHLGCPPEKTTVFPYWVPVTEKWDPMDPAEGRRNLAGLGQLIHRKGYDVALAAFAAAIEGEAIPEDVKLILAGSGKKEASLREQASRLRILNRVRFPGWLDEAGKRDLFSKTAVFIHPARWEPFGVVVLEAMERGLPVLGSNCTMAALDRIQHGVSGYLHNVGDVRLLSEQIASLYVDRNRWALMSESARQVAEAWNPSRSVEILKEVFNSACNASM